MFLYSEQINMGFSLTAPKAVFEPKWSPTLLGNVIGWFWSSDNMSTWRLLCKECPFLMLLFKAVDIHVRFYHFFQRVCQYHIVTLVHGYKTYPANFSRRSVIWHDRGENALPYINSVPKQEVCLLSTWFDSVLCFSEVSLHLPLITAMAAWRTKAAFDAGFSFSVIKQHTGRTCTQTSSSVWSLRSGSLLMVPWLWTYLLNSLSNLMCIQWNGNSCVYWYYLLGSLEIPRNKWQLCTLEQHIKGLGYFWKKGNFFALILVRPYYHTPRLKYVSW